MAVAVVGSGPQPSSARQRNSSPTISICCRTSPCPCAERVSRLKGIGNLMGGQGATGAAPFRVRSVPLRPQLFERNASKVADFPFDLQAAAPALDHRANRIRSHTAHNGYVDLFVPMQRERIFDHRRCANWGNSRHSGRSIAPLGRVSYVA
jgi:hypothetical protein